MKTVSIKRFYILFFLVLVNSSNMVMAQPVNNDTFLLSLLNKYPSWFDTIIKNKQELNVQVLYTRIDRDKKGKPIFTDFSFNTDDDRYYYPASTVKLPIAILALQKLNELNISGLGKNTTMITGKDGDPQTEVFNDPTAKDGRPTIAHYIKKILLVSDNDAFNRLYEFLGQEYINNTLHAMGYDKVQIIHRLSISLPEADNRHTNPVQFFDSTGKLLYSKPAEQSKLVYASRNTKMGKGYYRGDQLVNEPFDFSVKNRFTLTELHSIVRSIMFPDAMPDKMRFNLTKDDYDFLRRYMSMTPPESISPVYDTAEYWDTYVKFLFYGAEKNTMQHGMRIFNKPGDAYGFMIDGTYIVDYENNIEFLLSAEIHCNSDGIFNDDKYDYATVGLPFMKQLGRVIYNYERTRVRKNKPDFSSILFNYTE